ncbi:RH28, partial [Symbiodinium sp. KB8]
FMSNKEKAKLKQSEKQSLEEAEAKALARDDEKKESKKRKKGPLTEEELQEKRAQRNRSTASKEEISKAAPSGEGPATAGKLIQKYVTAVKRGRGQDQEGSAGKQDWAIYQEQLKQSFVKERNRYQEDAKRLGKAQKMKALITIQSILADPKKELEVKPEIPEDYEATREWDHLMVEANRAEEHMEVDERDALLLSPGIAQRRIQELPAVSGDGTPLMMGVGRPAPTVLQGTALDQKLAARREAIPIGSDADDPGPFPTICKTRLSLSG